MGSSLFRLNSFWQLQLIGWLFLWAWGLLGSFPGVLKRPGVFVEQTVSIALTFLLSCLLHQVCRSLLRRYPSWFAFEWRAFVASALCAVVGAFADDFIMTAIYGANMVSLAANIMDFAFVLFMWCNLYFSIKQWRQASVEKERLSRAEAEAREARLQALRYQLNPHFLFNSLNAVSTLVLEGNAAAATKMLAQIGDFLRTSLISEATIEVPLSQEMEFTRQYIAIEETRLGERLQVQVKVSPETLDAMVPSMLLQPLVENAVRHGVASLTEGGKIAIESGLHEGRLRISVRNSGRRGRSKQGEGENGIGKRNISERLHTLYGSDHQFCLEWPESGGCAVTVDLPMRRFGPREVSLR